MDAVLVKNEVLELTLACHRDDASPEERARLERLLADETEAIDCYLCVVDDTVTLRDAAEAESSDDDAGSACPVIAAIEAEEIKLHEPSDPMAFWRSLATAAWWATAACLVVVAATAVWWTTAEKSVASATPVDLSKSACIVSAANVQWADGAKSFQEWSFVQPGDVLDFEAGLLNVYLSNGAEILIEGPADLTFESLDRVVARRGKFAARVGPGAVGLRIETPHANVIDRGTAFGLSIDANCRTSVVVYEGIVDLDVVGDSSHPRRRLNTGEGLSVNKHGELSRVTTVQRSDFLEPPQSRAWNTDEGRVITSVSDNVRSLETAKYYRVISNGFREDARAYVDRDHQWNGVDDRGMPPFLVGGDYVMTFNDDKITTEIEIAVTLSRPASLYVIVDDRVPPPEWLARDFVDTNWDLGSDDGWVEGDIKTGLGAGVSIDHTCSIWRRDVPTASTVVLGALSQEKASLPAAKIERSMYGIVAAPLTREH